MKPLSNNKELYAYLLSLAAVLEKRGSSELSETVTHASRHASGMSTEFLGESRIALRRVSKETGDVLDLSEHNDLSEVLRQLDAALDKR